MSSGVTAYLLINIRYVKLPNSKFEIKYNLSKSSNVTKNDISDKPTRNNTNQLMANEKIQTFNNSNININAHVPSRIFTMTPRSVFVIVVSMMTPEQR